MIKNIALFLIAIIIVILTMYGATAISFDNDDEFVLSRGQIYDSYFIVETDGGTINIEDDSLLSFSSYNIKDYSQIHQNIYLIPYTITIPDDLDIDLYKEEVVVLSDGETKSSIIKIGVQSEIVSSIDNSMNKTYFGFSIREIIIMSFIFLFIIFIVVEIKNNIEGKIRKNKNFIFLVVLMFATIILSGAFFINETNIYYSQKNSLDSNTIRISDIVEGQFGGGYVIINRNSLTPSAYEMVTFEDGDIVSYFTISENEIVDRKVLIDVGEFAKESSTFYYDVNIYINGKVYKETYSFKTL